MSKLILLPDGNAISPEIVRAVSYHEGKGVLCRDAQSRAVCYIKEEDAETGKHIRDLLIKAVADGNAALQPDWSLIQKSAE